MTDARLEMARLSGIPIETPGRVVTERRRWFLRPLRVSYRFERLPRRGLDGIPERYRLQFLLLAGEKLPGRAPAEVAELAARLADTVHIPSRLRPADEVFDPKALDDWFREQLPAIKAGLDELAAV